MDNGHYRPITDEEFDLLKKELPDIGKLFEDGALSAHSVDTSGSCESRV